MAPTVGSYRREKGLPEVPGAASASSAYGVSEVEPQQEVDGGVSLMGGERRMAEKGGRLPPAYGSFSGAPV